MDYLVVDSPPLARRRNWTLAEFERLAESGFFDPDEKLELLEGDIVEKMTQREPHVKSLLLSQEALRQVFGVGYIIRIQAPLRMGQRSRPGPDLAVTEGLLRDMVETPSTAVLIVEISDSTLTGDRGLKASIYAANQIQDYWIVNLVDRVLEVHRTPGEMPSQPVGYGYRSIERFGPGQTVSPLAAPNSTVAVDDLLP
jgi:Uma2 family endonuclease